MGVSHSSDEGKTWEYVGKLCGPSDRERWRWLWEFGYPVATRLPDKTIFLVYYGPAIDDGNVNVAGVFLEDKTGRV